nr:hypothetical protein [uncultured Desulfobacter sp.]
MLEKIFLSLNSSADGHGRPGLLPKVMPQQIMKEKETKPLI